MLSRTWHEGGAEITLKLEFNSQDSHLEVFVTGVYNVQEGLDRFQELLSLCRYINTNALIIDCRGMTGTPLSVEKAMYAIGVLKYYEQHLAVGGKPVKIGYIAKAPIISDYEPGMDIARQNHLPIALFDTPEAARRWLALDLAPRVDTVHTQF